MSKLSNTNYPNASLALFSKFSLTTCYFKTLKLKKSVKDLKVAIATGFHLFPFRTEKLSPLAPMVLHLWESRSPPTFFKPQS